jgi:hypothetical protein
MNESHRNIFRYFEENVGKNTNGGGNGKQAKILLQYNEIFLCFRTVLFTLKCKKNPVVTVLWYSVDFSNLCPSSLAYFAMEELLVH